MLTTLPLYVLRELGKAMGLSVFVFSFVMLGPYAGTMLRDGVSLWTVMLTLPYMIPLISPHVLPLAILSGILVCYGRLAGNSEFVAAQAGGVHPLWLGAPALVMAALAVFVTVFLNEFALAPATRAIKMAYISDQTNILRRRLARPGSLTRGMHDGKFVAVCVLPRDATDAMVPIEITEFTGPPASPPSVAPDDPLGSLWDAEAPWPTRHIAARGHRMLGIDRGRDGIMRLRMWFDRPVGYSYGRAAPKDTEMFDFDSGEQSQPLGGDGRISISDTRVSYWSILRLFGERRETLDMLDDHRSGLERALDGPAPPTGDMLANMIKIIQALEGDVRRYTAQLNLSIALAFSCFSFALLGAPMGLALGRKEASTGFVAGTAVALAHFAILKGLQSFVENGALPWWMLWTPNAAMLALSLWYWRKIHRVAG